MNHYPCPHFQSIFRSYAAISINTIFLLPTFRSAAAIKPDTEAEG